MPADSVSRAHAAIINSSSASFISDLDSAHGTWYDEGGRTMNVPQLGVRLDPKAPPTKLAEGSTLRFGSHGGLIFKVTGTEQVVVDRWRPPPWAEPPSKKCGLEVRANDVSNPYLTHLEEEGGDVDEVLSLAAACTTFGRSAQLTDVVLRDDSVSRQHAAVLHAEADSFVLDLGSASGTFVDGKPLKPHKPHKLASGMAISLGTSRQTYTFRLLGGGGKKQRRA